MSASRAAQKGLPEAIGKSSLACTGHIVSLYCRTIKQTASASVETPRNGRNSIQFFPDRKRMPESEYFRTILLLSPSVTVHSRARSTGSNRRSILTVGLRGIDPYVLRRITFRSKSFSTLAASI